MGTKARATALALMGWSAQLALPSIGWAEVYKWTDESGQVHYGEKKASTSKAGAKPLIINDRKPSAAEVEAARRHWQLQDQMVNERQAGQDRQPDRRQTVSSNGPAEKSSRSGGKEDGTDASRCNLARDILDGSLRHSNGKPIDKYDLDTARGDVRPFCR